MAQQFLGFHALKAQQLGEVWELKNAGTQKCVLLIMLCISEATCAFTRHLS